MSCLGMKNEEFMLLGSDSFHIRFFERKVSALTLIPVVSVCGCQMIVYHLLVHVCVSV